VARPVSRMSITKPGFWVVLHGAALIASASAGARAGCPDSPGLDRQGKEQVGIVDIVLASRRSGCRDATLAAPARQDLAAAGLQLDGGPIEAQYRWSRTADHSVERHRVTLVPNLRPGLSMRSYIERAFTLRGGDGETRAAVETGLDLDGIRSRLSMIMDQLGDHRIIGANLRMTTSLLGEVLSARIDHGQWWLDGPSQGSTQHASSAIDLEYARGGARISARYDHQLDLRTGERRTYAAGAALPLRPFGLKRHTAELKAELEIYRDGDAVQAISLRDVRRGPGGRRATRLKFSQSDGGRQQTTFGISRTPFPDLTLESTLELTSGTGPGDTLVRLDAEYRF
jgi:hypothetical protein